MLLTETSMGVPFDDMVLCMPSLIFRGGLATVVIAKVVLFQLLSLIAVIQGNVLNPG